MKKAVALLLCLIMLLPMSVSAKDVSDAIDDAYIGDCYLPYRLILPKGYNENRQYPLVVFFHGAGERGSDNRVTLNSCIPYIAEAMPKAIILVPQCDLNSRWVDTDWGWGSYSVDEVPESAPMKTVMELVGELKIQYSIDKNCVYAIGHSMGGYAVWDAMIRHNDVFAAGVAICGAGDPSKAEVLKDTPMFVFHGNWDDTVPVSGSQEMVQAIKDAGGTLVEYIEYAGGNHGIWEMAIRTEGLLSKLQRCKLSDRYPEEKTDPQGGFEWTQILPFVFIGVAVVAVTVIVVVLVSDNKKKAAEKKKKEE